MAIQPVTYRPIAAIRPVTRQSQDESVRKAADGKPKRRGAPLDKGQGENLDTWV